MNSGEPLPQQMLAVLLGASSFRRAPNLAQGRAFYNSAQDFQEYLLAANGLGIPRENVAWFFDDSRSPSDQLQDIRDFLESRSTDLTNKGTPAKDLIVYYVGHGFFSGPDQTYCLAVRTTDERSEALTSMRSVDLAAIIKAQARFLRKFLILDCCFSAAAYKEFQSSPLQAGRIKLLDELPQKGTTLLCSSSAHDASLAPRDLPRTMFSDALLSALRQGHPFLGPRLSLSELGDLIKTKLHETHASTWVRPEVHSPDQREGDVASVGIFPNAAVEAASEPVEVEANQKLMEAQKHFSPPETNQTAVQETRQTPDVPQGNVKGSWAEAHGLSAVALGIKPPPKMLKLSTGKELLRLRGHNSTISGVAWSSDGERLATGSKDKTAKVWDGETGMELLTLHGHTDAINSIAWSPDGKQLATAGWDDSVMVWDSENGEQLLKLSDGDLYLVDWSADGSRLATICGVWDARTGKQLVMLEGDSGWVLSLAWNPDGKRLATGTRDEIAKVWDAESGKELLTLIGHSGEVETISWNPDGSQLATGSRDSTAKIWDAMSGKELLTLRLRQEENPIFCVAWSPHGKWLATGDSFGAKVWKLETGKELLTPQGHTGPVHSLAWSPDGKRLATGSNDGTAKIWDIGRELGEDALPNV